MAGKILLVRFVDCVPSAGCDFNPGCPYTDGYGLSECS